MRAATGCALTIRNAGLAIPAALIALSLAPAEGEDFASCGPGMSGSTFMSKRLKGEKKS